MNSFLRGLTRQDVITACGSGIEETEGSQRFSELLTD